MRPCGSDAFCTQEESKHVHGLLGHLGKVPRRAQRGRTGNSPTRQDPHTGAVPTCSQGDSDLRPVTRSPLSHPVPRPAAVSCSSVSGHSATWVLQRLAPHAVVGKGLGVEEWFRRPTATAMA